jgi:hypothetical protein
LGPRAACGDEEKGTGEPPRGEEGEAVSRACGESAWEGREAIVARCEEGVAAGSEWVKGVLEGQREARA